MMVRSESMLQPGRRLLIYSLRARSATAAQSLRSSMSHVVGELEQA